MVVVAGADGEEECAGLFAAEAGDGEPAADVEEPAFGDEGLGMDESAGVADGVSVDLASIHRWALGVSGWGERRAVACWGQG